MKTRKDQEELLVGQSAASTEGTKEQASESAGQSASERKPTVSPWRESLQRLRRDRRAMAGLGFIVLIIVIALVGPTIYQHIGGPYTSNINGQTYGPQDYHNFTHEELDRQNETPSAQYWLGTDQLGRDLLARLMQGILVSLVVALLVEVVDIGLGILVGVLAGYYGGWIDQFLARFTDLAFAFPGLLLIILVSGIYGAPFDRAFSHVPVVGANGNARLLLVSMLLALTIWPLMARYVRGQTLQLKEQQFVEAARTSGTGDVSIIVRHIIPNLFSIIVVAATLNISTTIVGEAGISLLGLGVQPPGSSIGLMISSATQYMQSDYWAVLLPSGMLALIVLAFSFVGDGLRDAFDPRTKS